MLTIEPVDIHSRRQVNRFVRIPYRLYADSPYWVPPPIVDVKAALNPKKHPFYEHSIAESFIAIRDGRDVGRITALENRRFNEYHKTRQGQFYFFECENDPEASEALFNRAFEWARRRNLDTMVGPKGFGALDGYGLLVEGFDRRQVMTMLNYNFDYYPQLVEAAGFEKEVDFISCYINPQELHLPERVHRIAERVRQRGTLQVKRFKDKRELVSWADRIGHAYNKAFINNWEYYPLTEREIKYLIDNIMLIASPDLIKVILHKDDIVGFLFGFHDVSAAMQRARGRLFPFGALDILLEIRRTEWVALNGIGILPQFQGIGGNALMYSEIDKTVREYGFKHADLTQVAESAVEMRRDLINLGGKPVRNHRVYRRQL
ncbi:MAG: hypothetical protein GX620_09830 [Chloroflexi bacterium]|nr:hypothetical protein [Chloroflexota bacterium]